MDESVSTSSAPSTPSSHGDIVSSLSSGMAALTASDTPTPQATPTSDTSSKTPAASPAAPTGQSDPRTPPIAAAPDPDADLSIPPAGPIPLDRHKKILDHTRQKVAEETRVAFEKEHGPWLHLKSQFTPEEFSTLVPTLKNLASNPLQFLHETAREMGLQLVPMGQQPAPPQSRQPSRAVSEEPGPDIAVQLENGQTVQTYSADQQARREQWLLGLVQGQLQPFREYQQQQEERAFHQRIEASARAKFAEMTDMEGFDELKPKIADIMANDKRYGLEGAYIRAYKEHFAPTRDAKLRQAWTDEQSHKARAANSSLTPTRRVTAENGPTSPPTTADILRQKAAELGVTL